MAFPGGREQQDQNQLRSGRQITLLTGRIPSECSLRLEGREEAREGESDDEVF